MPMGNIAHLSHLGQHGKIFSRSTRKDFLYVYILFSFVAITHVMCKICHRLVTPQAYTCDLGLGSQHFRDTCNKALPV